MNPVKEDAVAEFLNRPEHALWTSRLVKRLQEDEPVTREMLPECLQHTIGEAGRATDELMRTLSQAAGAAEPAAVLLCYELRVPKPALTEEVKEWLDQPQNARKLEELFSKWELGRYPELSPEQLAGERDNPFTKSLPRHLTVSRWPRPSKPETAVLTGQSRHLLESYFGLCFEDAEEAAAFWSSARVLDPKTPMQRWAAAPENRGTVRELALRLGRDGHTVDRGNIGIFDQAPWEALKPLFRKHPELGTAEKGIHSLDLMRSVAGVFGVSGRKLGKGFAMRDLNRRLLRMLDLLERHEAGAQTRRQEG